MDAPERSAKPGTVGLSRHRITPGAAANHSDTARV